MSHKPKSSPLSSPTGKFFRRLGKRWTGILTQRTMTVLALGLVVTWALCSIGIYYAEYGVQGGNFTSVQDGFWWGIVTGLTVGYGDRFPITTAGRLIGCVMMVTGVFGIAIMTSKISSLFLENVLNQGRGLVDSEELNNHFVILGWKEGMSELLLHILDVNEGLDASDIVLVARFGDGFVEGLTSHPRLKGIHAVVGDFFQAEILQKAAPERARKVLILSDRTPLPNGNPVSMAESDSRTVMAAMTLANIARGTLVTAEILDPSMDQYLKLASVSEIIYSREYSRLLLGNAAGGTGISNVVFDLLDPRTEARIVTLPIDETWVGMDYRAMREAYERDHQDCVLVGVLENTGNRHRIKELALRKAQQTPDVAKLVHNLRSVKELRCNHPVFHPPDDYKIPGGSMVIVIESSVSERAKGPDAPRTA